MRRCVQTFDCVCVCVYTYSSAETFTCIYYEFVKQANMKTKKGLMTRDNQNASGKCPKVHSVHSNDKAFGGHSHFNEIMSKKYQEYYELWPNKAELAALTIAKSHNLKRASVVFSQRHCIHPSVNTLT